MFFFCSHDVNRRIKALSNIGARRAALKRTVRPERRAAGFGSRLVRISILWIESGLAKRSAGLPDRPCNNSVVQQN